MRRLWIQNYTSMAVARGEYLFVYGNKFKFILKLQSIKVAFELFEDEFWELASQMPLAAVPSDVRESNSAC